MEQLAWMYQSCAVPVEMRTVDASHPGAFFAGFARDKTSGILELMSNAHVSYVRFDAGRYHSGYFCDKPEVMAIPKFLESQFHAAAGGQTPVLTSAVFPYVADLPQQAPNALINTYRELYWRIVDEVDKEFPGEAKRRAQKVSTGIVDSHKAITILSAPRGTDTPDSVVQPEELSNALTDWSLQLLEGVEVMMPGTAPKILREATREHRYVLQSAGYYGCHGRCRGEMAGTLYVVATPLGNLEDLSPRAASTLSRVTAIAAEDTRHTKPLLAHIGSRAELISFHAHSSDAPLRRILHLLASGKDVALVTDAGTPTVSDPGAQLVAAARARDVPVVTVPGPTAVAAALSVSGLGADRYLFLGFIPRKGAERRRLLDLVAKSAWTVVLFEAPPRVAELLEDLAAACGAERPAAVARELTKLFEETRAGTLAELAGYYAEAPPRGEVTVVVAGTGKPAREERTAPPDPHARARALLAQGMTRRDVAEQLAEETGITRNAAYRLVNEL